MSRKRLQFACGAGLMIAALNGYAVEKYFWDASGDHSWGTASNWADDAGTTLLGLPTSEDVVKHVKTQNTTLLVNGLADALDLLVANANSEVTVSVTNSGVMNVHNELKLGTYGSAMGRFSVDGGAAIIHNRITVGASSTGPSTLAVNSGSLFVTNHIWVGNKATSVVENLFSLTGGTCEALGATVIGRLSPGKLEMSGGTLISTNSALQIGEGAGASGMVDLSGGTIRATTIDIDRGGSGGSVNLYGGTLEILGSSAGAVEMDHAANMHFEGGVLEWKGDRLDSITNYVNAGFITWTNGMTNMPTFAWDHSWTNGESILFADYDDAVPGYSTVWAYNTATIIPPLPLPPDLDGPTTNVFNNASGDGLYTTSNNWDILTIPTSVDLAKHDGTGGVMTIPSQVEALDMKVGHNSTATVSVVSGGSLTVSNSMVVGSAGSVGVGVLSVDGGTVDIVNELKIAEFGGARNGIVELLDGDITVGNKTTIGGFSAGSTGRLSIVNGTFHNESETFSVGNSGDGTLSMIDGILRLDVANEIWNPLRVGVGSGSGIVNLHGGEIFTGGMILGHNNADVGAETINLYGGLLQVEGGFKSAISMKDDAVLNMDAGTFRWKGNRISDVALLVDGGFISWSNGMTNMLSETWDASWTNGTSILHASFDSGYTTVWAFDTTSLPSGYDVFAFQYGLQEGPTGDDDNDHLSNLAEYAINGDPTNAMDTGRTSMYGDGATFTYVHAKHATDDSLVYRLFDTTDLTDGSVVTNGFSSQVNGSVEGEYVTVTNNYDMAGKDQRFFELEIEQQ